MPHVRFPIRLLATASTALVLGLPLLFGSVRPAAALSIDPCLISPDQCSSLVVKATGDGTGLIETTGTLGGVQDSKITCERTGGTDQGTCSHRYWVGTGKTLSVYLFEEPFSGSKFCEVGSCWTTPKTKTIVLPPNTIATFSPEFRPVNPVTLTTVPYGTGKGTYTTSPLGISCPGPCSFDFPSGAQVSVTVTPDSTSVFGSWLAGPCANQGPTCTFTITSNVTLWAVLFSHVDPGSFDPGPVPIEVPPTPMPTLPPAVAKSPTPTAGSVVITTAPPIEPSSAPEATGGEAGASPAIGDTAYGGPTVAPVASGLDTSPVANASSGSSDTILIAVAIIVAGLLIALAVLAKRRSTSPA
jgi:hypothetical protein